MDLQVAGRFAAMPETLASIAFCTSVACSGPFSLFEYCSVVPCAFRVLGTGADLVPERVARLLVSDHLERQVAAAGVAAAAGALAPPWFCAPP